MSLFLTFDNPVHCLLDLTMYSSTHNCLAVFAHISPQYPQGHFIVVFFTNKIKLYSFDSQTMFKLHIFTSNSLI